MRPAMSRHHGWRPLALMMLVVLVAACTSAPAPTPRPTATATAAPTMTPLVTPSTSPTLDPSAAAVLPPVPAASTAIVAPDLGGASPSPDGSLSPQSFTGGTISLRVNKAAWVSKATAQYMSRSMAQLAIKASSSCAIDAGIRRVPGINTVVGKAYWSILSFVLGADSACTVAKKATAMSIALWANSAAHGSIVVGVYVTQQHWSWRPDICHASMYAGNPTFVGWQMYDMTYLAAGSQCVSSPI
jgi:hypothetical protein